MKQNIKKQLKEAKGFTIIEVALVLAIAGLIFLVVFLALPALQRSQRDTARRQDAGRIVSALQSCLADNQGVLNGAPSCVTTVAGQVATGSGYIGSKLSQITTATNSTTSGAVPPNSGATQFTSAVIIDGYTCNGAVGTKVGDASKNAAVVVNIESGTTYCAPL
jgi:prepilin-type N-terminal cleavage/methylation domain-containing protein